MRLRAGTSETSGTLGDRLNALYYYEVNVPFWSQDLDVTGISKTPTYLFYAYGNFTCATLALSGEEGG